MISYICFLESPNSYDGKQRCIVADPSEYVGWSNSNCEIKRRFICKVPASGNPTTIQPPTVPPPQACSEDGWIQFSKDQGGADEFCYFFNDNFNVRFNWFRAYDTCIEKGGRLASISSEQENNFIMQNLKTWMNPEGGWIGFHRDHKTGQFRWVDGSEDLAYNSWGPDGNFFK